jgi:hypothetical protein
VLERWGVGQLYIEMLNNCKIKKINGDYIFFTKKKKKRNHLKNKYSLIFTIIDSYIQVLLLKQGGMWWWYFKFTYYESFFFPKKSQNGIKNVAKKSPRINNKNEFFFSRIFNTKIKIDVLFI